MVTNSTSIQMRFSDSGPEWIQAKDVRCKLKKILRNSARCLKCRDEVESKTVYDDQTCSCGNVTVDGGLEYLRRSVVDVNLIEETSIQEAN